MEGLKFHCDGCQKDITEIPRVRCADEGCVDYDLCVECFCAGKETAHHKNTHAYRVMDRTCLMLYDMEWSAEEELILLDALAKCGMGNWMEIADHVGTKDRHQCEQHYLKTYLESTNFPRPPPVQWDAEQIRQAKVNRVNYMAKKVDKKPLLGTTKPAQSVPANHEIAGYMPGRGEFETEHDNEAELLIKDMNFDPDDTPEERELKLTMLYMYGEKLEKRARRRHFIEERGMLDFKKTLSQDRKRSRTEKDLYRLYQPFVRMQTVEDFRDMIANLLEERECRQQVIRVQEYRRQGLRRLSECQEYDKAKQARLNMRTPFPTTTERMLSRFTSSQLQNNAASANASELNSSFTNSHPHTDANVGGQKIIYPSAAATPLDLSNCAGVEILSHSEKDLCSQLRILPRAYLSIKETLIREFHRVGPLKKRQIRSLVRIDVNKMSTVFDFFVSKGFIEAHDPLLTKRRNNDKH